TCCELNLTLFSKGSPRSSATPASLANPRHVSRIFSLLPSSFCLFSRPTHAPDELLQRHGHFARAVRRLFLAVEPARIAVQPTAQRAEIEQLGIHQVAGHHALQCRQHGVDLLRRFLLPGMQHALDLLALQVLLRAAEVARNDRELAERRPAAEVLLAAILETTNDD